MKGGKAAEEAAADADKAYGLGSCVAEVGEESLGAEQGREVYSRGEEKENLAEREAGTSVEEGEASRGGEARSIAAGIQALLWQKDRAEASHTQRGLQSLEQLAMHHCAEAFQPNLNSKTSPDPLSPNPVSRPWRRPRHARLL